MSDFKAAAAYEAAITVQTFARLIALDLAAGREPNKLEVDCVCEWALAAEAFLAQSYPEHAQFAREMVRRQMTPRYTYPNQPKVNV